MTLISQSARRDAQNLLTFIDASPSPWHAVATIEAALVQHGFQCIQEKLRWTLQPGGRYYLIRDDSTLAAFIVGSGSLAERGYAIVGAHTDSPGLRLKPKAAHAADPWLRLGVEVYGGPILATLADRDLSLAGRICLRDGSVKPVCFRQPLLRLPNLAIHMNRKVNDEGLKFNRQTELPLLLGLLDKSLPPEAQLLQMLAGQIGCNRDDIVSWEMHVYDTQPGAFWGANAEFIANSQLDNLASCHAALSALLETCEQDVAATRMCLFFDHEEVGSGGAKGAASSLLTTLLERIGLALALDREEAFQALANSFCISADMAHAYQPNFAGYYEPEHLVQVNRGPVVKVNVNQSYATNSLSEAHFIGLCIAADVPYQRYVHRTDLGCGGTIGSTMASKLGVPTADVGNPIWAMHSIRESGGVLDHHYMIKALAQFFA